MKGTNDKINRYSLAKEDVRPRMEEAGKALETLMIFSVRNERFLRVTDWEYQEWLDRFEKL